MFSIWGGLAGLALAIVLIVRKVPPAYALVGGALAGGLLGGGGLDGTVTAMIKGTEVMMPSVLRILASGVLVGALVKTGSAAKIADAIVSALGTHFALAAVALATAVVCAVGVFADIAVITVAPVALAVARKAGIPAPAALVAMVGGGKAGNVVSPNPNTIAVAEAFKLDLTSVMVKNLAPALVGLVVTVAAAMLLAKRLRARGEAADATSAGLVEEAASAGGGPSVLQALAGPLVVVVLLALRPLCHVAVDPLIALPAGGLVSILACGVWRSTVPYCEFGLSKVTGVAVLLIGTGTVAGIVKGSSLNTDMIALLNACKLPVAALAPLAGVLLAGATASTAAGVTIASQTFAGTFAAAGVPALSAAAALHAGGTVIDGLPHGSFFHATAGAAGLSVRARLALLPYDIAVGASITLAACLFGLF